MSKNTCYAIQQKIEENNKKIEELLDIQTFVLNKEIQPLLDENKQLFSQFSTLEIHEDDGTGVCRYCKKQLKK
jgi:hypothetical protein